MFRQDIKLKFRRLYSPTPPLSISLFFGNRSLSFVFNNTSSIAYCTFSHNVFTEQRHFDSYEVATEVKTATEGLSLAFLDQVFGKADTLERWERKHRALFSEYVQRR